MEYLGINFLEAIMDGSLKYDFGNGAVVCLIAILMVFVVLLIIIGISSIVSKVIDGLLNKKEVTNDVKEENNSLVVDVNDEDMMAAILVSSIDYRNEIKKDVKVVSIREVK